MICPYCQEEMQKGALTGDGGARDHMVAGGGPLVEQGHRGEIRVHEARGGGVLLRDLQKDFD